MLGRGVRLRSLVIWNVAASLALPASALLTGPLLARALGPDGRGALAAVLSPAVLAVGLMHLGLPAGALYFAARGYRLRSCLNPGAAVTFLTGMIAAAVLYLLSPVLFGDYAQYAPLAVLIAISLPLAIPIEVLRSCAQGAGAVRLPVVERFSVAALRFSLVLLLFLVGTLSVESAAIITWGSSLLVGLIYLTLWRERAVQSDSDRRVPVGQLLSYSGRGWVGSVAGILLLRVDQVLLITLTTPSQLGWYVVAVSIAEVPLMAIGGVRDVITTSAARDGSFRQVAVMLRIVIFGGVCFVGLASAALPLLVPLIFGQAFAGAVPSTIVLLLGSLLSGSAVILGAGLSAAGRPGLFSVAQVSALPVSVAALYMLAPLYGALGAAVATLIGYFLMAVVAIVQFCKVTRTSVHDLAVPRWSDFDSLRNLVKLRSKAVDKDVN